MEASAREIDARMRGKHPTSKELEEKRRLLDSIYEARARVNEIASISTQAEKYEILKSDFSGTLPSREDFATMLAENLELQNIAHREASLNAPAASSATRCFAHKAPPAEAEIKVLLNALASEEAAQATKREQKGSAKRTPAIVCLLLAIVSLVLAFALSPILFAAFGVLGVLSLIFFLQKDAPKGEPASSGATSAAREMLARYEFSTEGNLRDSLTELSLLACQWREESESEQKRMKALQALRTKKQQILRGLQEKFRALDITLPPQNDYRDDIEALRRDVSRITRTALEAEQRTRRRDAALAEQKRLQAELSPFLRHFDPEGAMKPAECLDRVQEWENEYRKLSVRIPALREELVRFVAEKGLEAFEAEQDHTTLPDVDALTIRERALQKELSEAQNRGAELKSHIGRLATDAERLPEIEATVRTLEEELSVARANNATISNTVQFLEEAKSGLSTRYLADMQTSFSSLLQTLMDKSTPESVMDTSFKVKLRESGKTQHPESLGQGWRDAVEFCVRLSLAEALYAEGEVPFIILDDPFVNLDERRLKAAKRLLASLSEKYQILYLVCHTERR